MSRACKIRLRLANPLEHSCTVMENIVEQGILYDFYGPLLTEHQQEIYEMAVYRDMSLAEIAEQEKISRQAVSDLIRRVTAQMQDYEDKLGLVERFRRIRKSCDLLTEEAASIADRRESAFLKKTAEDIRREL